MREQGQRTRLMTDIVQEQIHQPGLQLPAPAAGRFFDGAAQLVSAHGADVFLLLGQRFAQAEITRAVGVEIGAQGDDDDGWAIRLSGRGEQVIDKRSPFLPPSGTG